MQHERTTLVRARFGLPINPGALADRHQQLIARARIAATALDEQLAPGHIALITGPSGSGKSLVLNQLKAITQRAIITKPINTRTTPAVVNLFKLPLIQTTRILSTCGLADANQLVTPAGALSEGQRARLSIALALETALLLSKPCTIIADEFASTLDRTTACALAVCIRKQITPPIRLVIATAHDDLIEPLAPDVLMYTPPEGQPELLTRDESCKHIPGRSHRAESETDSSQETPTIPGRSASAREPSATTTPSHAFTTAPARPRHSLRS
ncbi:MAG: hypothetical protein COB69_06320 [Phycisphaera sp.]|nr:MAG: hypothetical protein COB69_06320 [Phycisphaera sp.]